MPRPGLYGHKVGEAAVPRQPLTPSMQAECLLQAVSTFQMGGLGVGSQKQGWGGGEGGQGPSRTL